MMQLQTKISAIIGVARISAFMGASVLVCALAVSYGTAIAQEVPTPPMEPAFNDVDVGDQHYIAVKFLKERNIIHGYEDGSFHPEREINRAEALKIILGTLYKAPQKGITPISFSDVSPNDWFAPYVETGVENGIVAGYPDGLFHPERTLNKAESLKMVLLQENQALPVTITEPPYSDVPVDEWFAAYAQVSKERGLFIETRSNGGELEPQQKLNRGNFAEMIYHLLQSSNGKQFGRATYYADILAGRGTASGDPYDPRIFTVAHKTLPFGTMMRVTNLANGKSVEVKVNDRGPYATGVHLDLSRSAFEAIAKASTGIIFTQFQIIQ